jgi:putrescine transport system permease protein
MRWPDGWLRLALGLGLIFLYLPLVLLVMQSFNDGRLVTVWSGFSTRWYASLLHNTAIQHAAFLSLGVAAVSASLAAVLGTALALVLDRGAPFRGRGWLSGLGHVPLVLPELVLGLAFLLLFVNLESLLGWPQGRGRLTLILAHATVGLAYVAVVVRARLADMPAELEEAAMDLGASPLQTFLRVTLPLILPGVIAGWLLAFTLSLDDVVIASFVSGPGASTLPMLVYSKMRLGLTPEINALASLLILVVLVGVSSSLVLLARRGGRSLSLQDRGSRGSGARIA